MTRRVYEPRPYQPLGTNHVMDNKRCALWAGMGLGKGVMVLDALDKLSVTEDVFPALAIGPLRVARDVWPTETDKWECFKHLHCIPIIGTPEERMRAVKAKAPIYSINYECVPWLVEHWGDRWPYKTVIADEATKLKGYRGSYRTSKTGKVFLQGAGGMRARALGTVAHTPRVTRFIELTGTPAPNGLVDLWGAAWYLDAGTRLGRTFEGFKQRWFHPKYNGFGVDPNKGSDAEIHERLKDICLSIEARDWFSLKEPIVNDIYVDLPVDARRHYAEMERDMFSQIGDSTVEAFGAAAMTNKCRQLAGGAVYIDAEVGSDDNSKSKKWKAVHNAKMEALDSCIEEAAGASMIVVYAFRSELARILKAYPGAVDLSTKDGMKRFKSGDATLGAAHPASLGHGVDGLQAVCNVITHLGHDWALDTYQQINERIGPVRQMQSGLDRSVFVNRIIARDTLDEQVIERRLGKRTVQEMLLEAMKLRGRT